MPYLIGTDEAGYGPNLGPLVISASVWRTPDPPAEVHLYRRLRRVVAAAPDARRIAIADSKVLYKSGGDLRLLERGLLPAVRLACGEFPCDWQHIWELLGADGDGHRHDLPWHAGYQTRLPLAVGAEELDKLAARLQRTMDREQIVLRGVFSRAVFPQQFNQCVEAHGGKGAALSTLTLQLLADVMQTLEPEPMLVVCDKHGGRNFYRPLLQQAFPDRLVEVHAERREQSIYRWGPPPARVEVRFCTRGEAFMPTALASMACKYLRELSMRAFNDYWLDRVADLRPTAGYPGDARRFKMAIEPLQHKLGIQDHILWRER